VVLPSSESESRIHCSSITSMFFVPTITAQMFVSDMTAVLPSKPGNPQRKEFESSRSAVRKILALFLH